MKISVVLSILRNALGTGQVPSGMIISGLSVILTLYVMTPVGQEIAEVAGPAATRVNVEDPLEGDSYEALMEAIDAGKEPLKRNRCMSPVFRWAGSEIRLAGWNFRSRSGRTTWQGGAGAGSRRRGTASSMG